MIVNNIFSVIFFIEFLVELQFKKFLEPKIKMISKRACKKRKKKSSKFLLFRRMKTLYIYFHGNKFKFILK